MMLLMPDDVPLHYKSIRVTLMMDYKESPFGDGFGLLALDSGRFERLA